MAKKWDADGATGTRMGPPIFRMLRCRIEQHKRLFQWK
jgi:hypothetical protein